MIVGEFSSPKQGTFYHYNDFWRLDPSTREWTKIESKGKGPPARSGHRLVYYKVSPSNKEKIAMAAQPNLELYNFIRRVPRHFSGDQIPTRSLGL